MCMPYASRVLESYTKSYRIPIEAIRSLCMRTRTSCSLLADTPESEVMIAPKDRTVMLPPARHEAPHTRAAML